ncbi:MAG: SpoIIE family protein phosphatase [Bacteroidales bacterium]|nr:SpoIIE family protein phosphatase [Bacteroidales bacterium]
MTKLHKALTLIWLILLLINSNVSAQSISENVKNELENYENLITKYKNDNNPQLELEYLNKAAFLCWNNQLYNKSIGYFENVLELNKTLKNQKGILLSTNYIGMIYDEIQDYNSALKYFNHALEICRNSKNKQDITSSLINISQTYQLLENYEESNKASMEGVSIAKEINNLKFQRTFYGILANNYQNMGNSEKSIEYFDLFSSVDKYLKNKEISNIKTESKNQVNKVQAEKQQTEKELLKQTDKLKETESSLAQVEELTREQQMQLELKESKIREQDAQLKFERLVRSFLIGGFLVFLIFFIILFMFFKKIKNQKLQIEKQRDVLDLQNQKINSSIQYAQNIQRAILPVKNQLANLFESFIIYKPKDVVSGDFYWFTEIDNMAFLAAVDCTGHGVPGAFMSMIGNSLLNEIVLEKKEREPAKILSLLNEKVVDALRQKETDNSDGMDMCFISIELKTNKITFSGAKRPLFFYNTKTKELEEIKGNRISIGGVRKTTEVFNNHIIQAETGDIFYLSSDGLTDQNNLERKRFGSSKLKEIIINNISLPMQQQKEIIEDELNNFQKDEEQRDDITLIGIKIN